MLLEPSQQPLKFLKKRIRNDKNSLVGLNRLKLVCLYNNPISNLFPSSLSIICETNKECTVKILDKCIRKEYTTSTITTTTLTTTKNAGNNSKNNF